jgi:hypothetical protein
VIPLSCGAFCHLLDDDPHYLASSTARQPSDVVDRLDKSNVIDACQLRRSVEARQHAVTFFKSRLSLILCCVLCSDFLARYLTGSDAAPPARSPSPNYSDSDCCVCWSELRQGTCTLYKMICCGRLVHLDCVKQVSERKSTSERRECVACYAEVSDEPEQ